MEARWYRALSDGRVRCLLCPHVCVLAEGETGSCRVRSNKNGKLISEIYGKVSSIHADPVEKKPLYHFFPGRKILSVGTVGCNLHCKFCQNSEISQVSAKDASWLRDVTPGEIVKMAAGISGNIGIAYTYNEPSIWIEFVEDVAREVHAGGMKNVMVTNGYINPAPLEQLIPLIDAFSVDLKAFTGTFYRQLTESSIEPVKRNLEFIRRSGKHLEIVNLVIPELNDEPRNFEDMVKWISDTLGSDTVFHLSAYHPSYLSNQPPTPPSTIRHLHDISEKYLRYVYSGNLPGERNDTLCPSCGKLLISREGYYVENHAVSRKGSCKFCGEHVFENF